MKKIIVTGGMGYIGSHTIVELVNSGYEPIIFDNLHNSSEDVLVGLKEITGKDIEFINVDLSNAEAAKAAFDQHADNYGVIHFAALKAVGESVEKPGLYYRNNVFGIVNVIENMQRLNQDNFIFSSSCTVYGQPDVLPVTENSPVQKANSPYGFTKQIGEQVIYDFINDKNNFKAISLRYFNPIGAHDSVLIGELPLGVPNNLMPFITQTAAGIRESLSVFGSDYNTPDGTAIRDYIHVVDLAKAHVIAVERLLNDKNKTRHEIFNLGTGQGYSVLDVINSFEKTTGEKLNYKLVDRRAGDVEQIFADPTFANEELGWTAKLSLDDMTKSAWEWEKKIRNID